MTTALTRQLNSLLNFEDVLFRDFFVNDGFFDSIFRTPKLNYPVDIKEVDDALEIEIAAVGLDSKDIKVETKDNILKVSYKKEDKKGTQEPKYIHRGITKRSFNFGWKIMNPQLNLDEMQASMENGLLKIRLPLMNKEEISIEKGFRRIEIE